MNTNNTDPQPQIRGRSRLLRSLLVAASGALVLMGFMVPRADAQAVVSYFNFENGPGVDLTPDFTPAAGGDNPGGGVEPSTTNLTITSAGNFGVTPGLLTNRTAGDNDTANPGLAVNFNKSSAGDATISFCVNTQFYAGLSLSFAYNNNGNGYNTVTLSWTGATGGPLSQPLPTGQGTITFNLPSSVDGNGTTFKFVCFTLTFSGGQSNGNDLQTVIDNIQLDAKVVVPEPATVAAGLLGVCGLCWHQRRRLNRFLSLRPA